MIRDSPQRFPLKWGIHSLPVRLMLAIAGVALASVGTVTFVFVNHQRQLIIDNVERHADLSLNSLALAAANLEASESGQSAEKMVYPEDMTAESSRGAIFTTEGTFIAGVGDGIDQWSPSILNEVHTDSNTLYLWQGDRLQASRQVNDTTTQPTVIVVELSTIHQQQNFQQLLLDATEVALGAGAVSLLLALMLSRTITSSFKQMVTTTERIASGQFSERLPVGKGGSELTLFAQSFNQMASNLQETIARHRALVRYSLDAIVVLDCRGNAVELNPTAERMFACSARQMQEQPFAEWAIAAPWGPSLQAELQAVANGDANCLLGRWREVEAQRPNGSTFPAEISLTNIHNQREVLFTVTLRDITERRQAALRLQQSEARLRQIVRSAPIGIALVDANTQCIQEVNPALTSILGHHESTLVGAQFETLGLVLPVIQHHPIATFTNGSGSEIAHQKTSGSPTSEAPHIEISPRTANSVADQHSQTTLDTATHVEPLVVNDRQSPEPAIDPLEATVPLSLSCQSEQTYHHPNSHEVWLGLTIASLAGGEASDTNLVMVEDITEHKQVEFQLRHEALHDPLTGLANRALLIKRLSRACDRFHSFDSGHDFAVLFLDCDRFKTINDTLGHEVGDRLLVALARRLEECVREGDTVARLGGDEFTVLLKHIREPDEAVRVADRIIEALNHPLDLGSQQLTISASIGIVNSHLKYRTAESILKDADSAMYRAKTLGRAQHALYAANSLL